MATDSAGVPVSVIKATKLTTLKKVAQNNTVLASWLKQLQNSS